VKFEAHGEVSVAKGPLAQFLQNLPTLITETETETKEFFNILPGNFDPNKCSTPVTVFALLTHSSSSFASTATSYGPQQEQLTGAATPAAAAAAGGGGGGATAGAGATPLELEPLLSDLEAILSEICNGQVITGSMKTTILPVAYSVAPLVAGKIHGTPVFLAGDAALGLPLEKGLNYGWKIASRLCHYLAFSPSADSAAIAFQTHFTYEAQCAVEEVEAQYRRYVLSLESVSALRRFLRPFASLLLSSSSSSSSSSATRKLREEERE
jgi:hypothetical protein